MSHGAIDLTHRAAGQGTCTSAGAAATRRLASTCAGALLASLSLSVSVLLVPAGARAAQDGPKTVAFLGLSAKGVSKDVASNVADIVATELGGLPAYKVITADEINAMLGMERLKDSLGCTDSSCLAELGGSLGADYVLSGSVGKLGDVLTVSLALVDIGKAETAGRAQAQASGLSELPAAARNAVARLTGGQVSSTASGLRGRGSLFVNSNPKGAAVFLDGKKATQKGKDRLTPLTIDDIAAGDHVLEVQVGDLAREIPVLVKADQINKYTVNLKVVRVKLTSVPFEAEVLFDGEPRGSTPVLLPEVPAGRYEVVFRKAGFKETKTLVELDFEEYRKSGEAQVVSGTLDPLPVDVTCRTEPPGATILVDGVDKGRTPLVVKDLLPGAYKVEVSKPGYRTEIHKLEIKPAKPMELTAQLAEYVAHVDYVKATATHDLLAVGAAIGGGGLLLGSAIVAVLALGDKGDASEQDELYNSAVVKGEIDAARKKRDDAASSYAGKGTMGLGLAAAGLAAGAVAAWLLLTPPQEPDYTLDARVVALSSSYNPATGGTLVSGIVSF